MVEFIHGMQIYTCDLESQYVRCCQEPTAMSVTFCGALALITTSPVPKHAWKVNRP